MLSSSNCKNNWYKLVKLKIILEIRIFFSPQPGVFQFYTKQKYGILFNLNYTLRFQNSI